MELTYEVYHGNCFDRLAELPDKSVTLLLTDPPYGHNNNNGDLASVWEAACRKETARRKARGNKHGVDDPRPIHNDGKQEADNMIKKLFSVATRILNPSSCCCCCCGGGGPDPQFARWSRYMDKELSFIQQIIWDKGPGGLGWRYRRTYETVLVATRKGGKMSWYDRTGRVWNVIRPGDYGIHKITPTADQHPTQKPVELFELFIRLHTKPGDLVVDPFCGSGSSGVAAKKLGRSWLGCDTDIRWVEMTRRRLAATTSRLPELMEAERAELEEMERQGVFAECEDDTQGETP